MGAQVKEKKIAYGSCANYILNGLSGHFCNSDDPLTSPCPPGDVMKISSSCVRRGGGFRDRL